MQLNNGSGKSCKEESNSLQAKPTVWFIYVLRKVPDVFYNHSGKAQICFWEGSGKVQGRFRESSGKVQRKFRENQGKLREGSRNVPETF